VISYNCRLPDYLTVDSTDGSTVAAISAKWVIGSLRL
jgi:hypothetical protein